MEFALETQTSLSLVDSNWNQLALNLVGDLFLLKPFIHSELVYINVTNSKFLLKDVNYCIQTYISFIQDTFLK